MIRRKSLEFMKIDLLNNLSSILGMRKCNVVAFTILINFVGVEKPIKPHPFTN